LRKYSFVLLVLFINFLHAFEPGFTKEYYEIRDSKVKKIAFVDLLLPKIKHAEKQILSDRVFIKKFFKKYMFTYSFKSRVNLERLIKLAKKYRIKQMYNEHEYLEKIDVVPVSLVLAQSAVESAWGSSRFAREGNNIFGEWTWGKKGLIPKGRDENAKHKLRIFKSLDDSIARYMLNLNRHRSYKEFRRLRARYRAEGKVFTGLIAATTMTNYSQMRKAYNRLLVKVIKGNGFMGYEVNRQKMLAAQ
jgi:Bax protein